MDRPTRLPDPLPVRGLAVLSAVAGGLAGLFLIGFFTLEPYGVRLAGVSLGTVNDVLGAIQLGTLAPVAWALGQRLPATRVVRVATGTALIAMVGFVVLSVLLVAGVLTFDEQVGPVIATVVALYAWLLTVNLAGHRTRTLPRVVTRTGVLLAGVLLTGLVLAGAGAVLPGLLGRPMTWLGYSLAGLGWLGLPLYVLLLATAVFGRPPPSSLSTDHHSVPEGISS